MKIIVFFVVMGVMNFLGVEAMGEFGKKTSLLKNHTAPTVFIAKQDGTTFCYKKPSALVANDDRYSYVQAEALNPVHTNFQQYGSFNVHTEEPREKVVNNHTPKIKSLVGKVDFCCESVHHCCEKSFHVLHCVHFAMNLFGF